MPHFYVLDILCQKKVKQVVHTHFQQIRKTWGLWCESPSWSLKEPTQCTDTGRCISLSFSGHLFINSTEFLTCWHSYRPIHPANVVDEESENLILGSSVKTKVRQMWDLLRAWRGIFASCCCRMSKATNSQCSSPASNCNIQNMKEGCPLGITGTSIILALSRLYPCFPFKIHTYFWQCRDFWTHPFSAMEFRNGM